MAASAAVLGPYCDSQHSSHDILHYVEPTILAPIETCWWVPPLFAVAGVILGVGHPLLDKTLGAGERAPGWPVVVLGIALFVVQYWISGALEPRLTSTTLMGLRAHDCVLLAWGVAMWAALDRTRHGLGLALLTAVAGPALEVFLINVLGLYSYTSPDALGVPFWIPWVYFAGAPANGNLGRQIRAQLLTNEGRDRAQRRS
ncbi:unnamed protein product [Pedinophyceae sp. YPF-701]|nr:unnamed protein product [Pedinophyceae sp. YPF-701]